MALKRTFLEGLGLEDKQIQAIVEAHSETVEGLKSEIAKYKTDAEKLPAVQKELDDLKAKGDDGWKDKHDKVKKEFDDYKADITAKEAKAAKEKAVRAYYESKNIEGANLNLAMRSSSAEIEAVELDGDKIKDASALDALISGDFANLVTKTTVKGAQTATPPTNNGGKPLTKEDIMAIPDRAERRRAIAENQNLFVKE